MMTLRARRSIVDAVLAVVAFALTLALLAKGGFDNQADVRGLDALGVVLAACASLPIAALRRGPLAVFVLMAVASSVLNALDYGTGPPPGPTIGLFFLAARADETRARSMLTAATIVGAYLLHAGSEGLAEGRFPTAPLLFGALVWGGVWVLGDRVRLRRARLAALEERVLGAEREAERERRLAAAEERTRIARDLHDSAGHAINVILVQAGAARLLQDRDPGGARAAIETIEDVARETLGEIDRLVRVLREDGSGRAVGSVEPPPGLAALDSLTERHRAAGLDVDVREEGARRPLPQAVDHAAYRILQESLTNAARHGRGRADVLLAFDDAALELTVENPSDPARPRGAGLGIVGMRERATLLGGALETTAAADGVFRVFARLLYDIHDA
jgi:signal transduction histidine kinase